MKLSEKELKELKHLLQSTNLSGYPNLLDLKKKISSNDKVELFIDGSADLHSKTAGIGGVIFINKEKFKFFSEYLHDSTNNEAEYESLIFGIEMLIENKLFNANIFSDSQLVVNQVNGIYKIKNDNTSFYKLNIGFEADLYDNLEIKFSYDYYEEMTSENNRENQIQFTVLKKIIN